MRKIRLSVLTAALALTASGAALAADDLSPGLQAAMQRDLGLSGKELAQYLKAERLAATQEKTVEKQLGRHFAGAWLERKADGSFGFVAATTSIKAAKTAAGIETRQARHSLSALNAAKGQLDSQLARNGKAPKGVYSWAVDLPSNSVVVAVAPGAEESAVDFVARTMIDAFFQRAEHLHRETP